MNRYSTLALIGALVAIAAFATGAVLFISDTDETTQRLGILFALFGAIVTGIISALKSDAAAKSTDSVSAIAQALNGGFEARVRNANRDTAAETGSRQDINRAEADAETSRRLTEEHNGIAPVPPVTGNPKIGD
jgi:hypothetical protein